MARKYQVYSRITFQWLDSTKKEYDETERHNRRITYAKKGDAFTCCLVGGKK